MSAEFFFIAPPSSALVTHHCYLITLSRIPILDFRFQIFRLSEQEFRTGSQDFSFMRFLSLNPQSVIQNFFLLPIASPVASRLSNDRHANLLRGP
jgi:hypothetical protein